MQGITHILRYGLCAVLALWLPSIAMPVQAHNGALVFAVPVEGITIWKGSPSMGICPTGRWE